MNSASKKDAQTTPLFCLKTTDKKSGRKLYINFKASDEIPAPSVDIEEQDIIREVCQPSPDIEKYVVPLSLGQIFWLADKEKGDDNCDEEYVIDIHLNDKFAFRKVIPSEVIRHYLITVAMVSIEDKFNAQDSHKTTKQFIGHKLDLDQATYEILEKKLFVDRSNQLVSNKVTIESDYNNDNQQLASEEAKESSASDYDLYYRPQSMLLTCSLSIEKLPDSIGFNDDRLQIQLDGKIVLDIFLPLNIDLNEPMKYKYDDRTCLLRIVFKMNELSL